MIELNKYYKIQTFFGERVIKCLELLPEPYGVFSISSFENEGDNQGSLISEESVEATEEEAIAWDNWYN